MTCSTHPMAQDNTLCRAYYQESYDRAKMTYSRIDLLERGPSFTQLMAKCNGSRPSHCKRTVHVDDPRAPRSWTCEHKHHAASCAPALVACTLRMPCQCTEHEDADVAPKVALATAHGCTRPAMWIHANVSGASGQRCCELPAGVRAEHVEDEPRMH